jgi:hypothetical protein
MTDEELRNSRQLRLAASVIQRYEDGTIPFRQLVDELDVLRSEIDAPEDWRGRFLEHRWTLEQALAVSLDQGLQSGLNPDLRPIRTKPSRLSRMLRHYPGDV